MRPDTILEKRGVMTRFLGVPRFLWLCGLATTLPLQGCIHDLLSVTDPDIITDDQLNANTAAGAVALHNGAILRLEQATAGPQGPDALFGLAAANADSALNPLSAADAASRGADSLRVKWLAQVVKGRALLDRARAGMAADFAVAAAAVAGVPDTFHYDVTYSLVTADNQNWALNVNARRYTMGDNEGDAAVGGNGGLPYFSPNDPRLPRRRGGPQHNGTISSDSVIFDTAYPLFVIRHGTCGRGSLIPLA